MKKSICSWHTYASSSSYWILFIQLVTEVLISCLVASCKQHLKIKLNILDILIPDSPLSSLSWDKGFGFDCSLKRRYPSKLYSTGQTNPPCEMIMKKERSHHQNLLCVYWVGIGSLDELLLLSNPPPKLHSFVYDEVRTLHY